MCIDFSFFTDSTFWSAISGGCTAIMAFLTWRNLVLIRKEKEANIQVTIIAARNKEQWPCYFLKFSNVGGKSTLFSFTLPTEFIENIPIERAKTCLCAVNGKSLYLEAKSSKYYVLSYCDTSHMSKDNEFGDNYLYKQTSHFLDEFMDYEIKVTLTCNKKTKLETLILRWFDSQATVFEEPIERIANCLAYQQKRNLFHG